MSEKRELTIEEKYKILQANHKALVEATTRLEKKYHKRGDRIAFLENALLNAQKQVEIQKQIVRDSLEKHNQDNQNYANELQDLKFGKDRKKAKPVVLPIRR